MPDATDWLTTITTDYHRLQAQKASRVGGVEGRVLLNLAFEAGEQYTSYANKTLTAKSLKGEQEQNKLHLVFNLLAQRGRKLVGRLASIAPVFKARPDKKDPKAFELAEVVDRMIVALDQKLDQPARTWELLDWLRVGGVAFEYTPWIENTTLEPTPQFTAPTPEFPDGELLFRDLLASRLTGTDRIIPETQQRALVAQGRPPESFEVYELVETVGEVGSVIYGPLNVFLEQGVRSIADLAPDQAVYLAEPKTHGWIEETYGEEAIAGLDPDKDIRIVTTTFTQSESASVAGVQLADLVPMLHGSCGKDDPPMNVVVERYQPASKKFPHGRHTCFIPGKKVLFDGENKYADIPLTDFHWSPVTKSFWTKDYVTDLIAAQRFLNKRMSQLGEQANATLYSNVLGGPGMKAQDIPADYPGFIENAMGEHGEKLVGRMDPPQLPSFFMQSIDLVIKLFNDLAGGADLFEESRFPGQLRGPLAVPLLQEILDTEWGPLYDHLGQRLARVKQMRMNRVKQFYPPIRTMHYTDKSQRDEVFEFHTDDILGAGTNFNITVDRGSLLPELRALRESRVRERLNSPLAALYTDDRTGRLDKSKIAADLQFGDAARESQAAQYRKLAAELIARIWKAEPVPPVQPFWKHTEMLDELESAMATTEWLSASQAIQQAFIDRWQQHMTFLNQMADQQQQAMRDHAVQVAVAQATQQAAAQAASATVTSSREQIAAQQQVQPETEQILRRGATQGPR
jgi:hypothetical protein